MMYLKSKSINNVSRGLMRGYGKECRRYSESKFVKTIQVSLVVILVGSIAYADSKVGIALSLQTPDTVYSLEDGCLSRNSAQVQESLNLASNWKKITCRLKELGKPAPYPLSIVTCGDATMPFTFYHKKEDCISQGGDPKRVVNFLIPKDKKPGDYYSPTTALPFCTRKMKLEEWLRWVQQAIQTRPGNNPSGKCSVTFNQARDGTDTGSVQNCYGQTSLIFSTVESCQSVLEYIRNQ